jgi:hypothetical protein
MKINSEVTNMVSTSLKGEIICSYAEIIKALGEPSDVYDDSKSDAEWYIEWDDGVVATIYNYKDGINYNGKDGTPTEDITDWHIGGNDPAAVERVKALLP